MAKSIIVSDSKENVCPLATLKALGFTDYELMLYSQQTLNFYGIDYKVLRATNLTLYVGAINKEVYFLEMDIKTVLKFGRKKKNSCRLHPVRTHSVRHPHSRIQDPALR